jgi:hypothetical protein
MHGFFLISHILVTIGFVLLYRQVRGVMHSPLRKATDIFAKAEMAYQQAELAHKKAGEVLQKAREAFDAAGRVNAQVKKIYFQEGK